MLELSLYVDSYRYVDRKITIDPNCVESVIETERRPPDSGVRQVAIIRMQSGVEHIVNDDGRRVAKAIRNYRMQP